MVQNIQINKVNYLIIFLVIFLSGGVNISFKTIISIFLIAVIFINCPKILRNSYFLKYSLIGFLLFVINLIVNFNNAYFFSYVFYFLHYLSALGVYFYYKYNQSDFSFDLYRVLKVIGYYSLIGIILMILFKSNMDIIQLNGKYYFHLFYIYFFAEVYWGGLYRLSGFFWEPGILQIYLNILLFYSLFIYKNIRVSWIAIIGIIASGSTTGYIIMAYQFGWFFFFSKKSLALMFLLIITLSLSFNLLLANIENKFQGNKITSFWARIYDTEMAVITALNNPLLGIGLLDIDDYSKIKNRYEFKNVFNSNIDRSFIDSNLAFHGNTNSLLKVASSFGIIIFIFYLLILAKQTIIKKQKLLFFTMILVFISTEPLSMTPFFFLFFISGLGQRFQLTN